METIVDNHCHKSHWCEDHGHQNHWQKRFVECRSGADKGNPADCYELGLMYSTGHGVGEDMVKAFKWFNLAASYGIRSAFGDMHDLKLELSVEQMETALKEARNWKQCH